MKFAQHSPFRQIGRAYASLLRMSDAIQVIARATAEQETAAKTAADLVREQNQGTVVAVCDRLDALNATVADLTVVLRAATTPKPSTAIHEVQGFQFLLDSTSLVDRMVLERGEWEGEQVRQLRTLAEHFRGRKNVAFLDLGSCWGYYTFMMWQTGIFDRVYAFDADACNFSQLQANIFLNKMDGVVHARHAAVSDGPGVLSFYGSRGSADGNRGAARLLGQEEREDKENAFLTKVNAVAIDDVLSLEGGHLVIKLDVEAHEAQALRGLRQTIAKNQVFVQVEIYKEQAAKVTAVLEELGLRRVASIYPDFFYTNVPFKELGF